MQDDLIRSQAWQVLADAAVNYATHGFRVFPLHGIVDGKCSCQHGSDCDKPGKHPRIHEWQRSASSDEEKVRKWFEMFKNSNIGLLCDGLVVIDIDKKSGGYESLQRIEENYGSLLDAPAAFTGGGGQHFFFQGDRRPTVNWAGLDGVDIRAGASYVVVPPSRHFSGNAYEWDTSILEEPMPECPEWLLRDPQRESRQGACVDVRAYGEGTRNASLTKHAGWMRRHGYEHDEIEAILLALNKNRCHPPLDEMEVRRIATSTKRWDPDPNAIRDVIRGRTDFDISRFPLTDGGNADAFFRLFGESYLHVEAFGEGWIRFQDGLWKQDSKSAQRDARSIAELWRHLARRQTNREHERALATWARRTDSARGIQDTLKVASINAAISAEPAQFDSNKLVLSTPGGVVDLTCGTMRPTESTDMLTLSTGVHFDANGDTSFWEKAVLDMMDGDKDLAHFLQVFTGYTLTGENSSQAWAMLVGEGSNGKSTFLDVLQRAMGSYSKATSAETWLRSANRNKDADMAHLCGVRLTVASEPAASRQLDGELIKHITGDGHLNARHLYGKQFTYSPTAKLWIMANSKPKVSDGSRGFWRRLRVIPFNRIFEPSRDFALRSVAEAPGLLTWAVRGAQMWFEAKGILPNPKGVDEAVDAYRAENDDLREWLDERTILDACECEQAGSLFTSYVDWCKESAMKPIAKTLFGKRLSEKGFVPRRGAKGKRFWAGIRLRCLLDD